MNNTEELLAKVSKLAPAERAELVNLLSASTPAWVPQPGPQRMAYESQADILFYGGSAGGGKSSLLLGLALTEHKRSIVFRREAVQLVGLVEDMARLVGTRDGYNSQTGIWRLPRGHVMELGSVKEPDDWMKYQGRAHDAKLFDELSHFTEPQFRALIGWLRSDDPAQRQRVVCAGNPPTSSEGEWVKRFWAAWLDPSHANPARAGELRWYVSDENGEDLEVDGSAPVLVGDELVKPKSRTFIPSRVDDNIFLSTTGYKSTLQSLPEPLRAQMLRGDFSTSAADPAWQLIPTEWVKAAQARWTPRTEKGLMTVVGLDPARGGADKTTAARRHGNWFDELISAPGVVTKDGPTTAGFVAPLIRNGAPVCVDSIGIGSSALDFIRGLGLLVHPVVGSESSTLMDQAGQMRFRNKRAEMYWRMREALDPTVVEPISLPPDQELLGDLCAVRYKVVSLGRGAAIQIRGKDEIRQALGRSPDKGDAVAMTFVDGIPRVDRYQRPKSWRDRLKIRKPRRGTAQAA
jgi:hypothetical protein